jgi:uncharacterized protein DUF397
MAADHHPSREPTWFKSSYSGGNATECLEAAFVPSDVLVRDSKQPSEALIRISPGAWWAFTQDIPSLPRTRE